jgi:chromosome segregation ATPase
MTRLLAGEAQRTDGQLTVSNLAAEAGLTRQQAYRSPVIQAWRQATRDSPASGHPDKTQARIERLARDLAAAQQRAQRYRQERDEARAQAKTLANACGALDEENAALRTALADAPVVSPLRS